jgi:hypothetical protein
MTAGRWWDLASPGRRPFPGAQAGRLITYLPVRRLSATHFDTPQLAHPEWLEETPHDAGESFFGVATAAVETFLAEAVAPQPPSEQSQSPHRRTGS